MPSALPNVSSLFTPVCSFHYVSLTPNRLCFVPRAARCCCSFSPQYSGDNTRLMIDLHAFYMASPLLVACIGPVSWPVEKLRRGAEKQLTTTAQERQLDLVRWASAAPISPRVLPHVQGSMRSWSVPAHSLLELRTVP